VAPYFERFVAAYPRVGDLATANLQDVLRLWQGLGYYSRARHLHQAAQMVVERFGGQIPDQVEALLELPGVGRYTAGAVASLAFERKAPILDGNVLRVLCRLDGVADDPRSRRIQELLWARAQEILPEKNIGDFNSALMELGATRCTPRTPRCLSCPVRSHCCAYHQGMQDQIPPPRKSRATPLHQRWVFCIEHRGRWLIEQRPSRGRWAGMWQFITIPATGASVHAARLSSPKSAATLAKLGLEIGPLKRLGTLKHALTHRRYEFEVFVCLAKTNLFSELEGERRWADLDELSNYPLPWPHLKIAQWLKTPEK
jgi:A/G-specific adenine glycosylase